jgi:DNA-binding response OmpR family regulator
MHILVVDDDVRLARHIMSGLTHEGHDAVVVHEGEAGLEKAMAGNFELIVLDVAMPRLDGFEVLRRLRACKISTWAIASPVLNWELTIIWPSHLPCRNCWRGFAL